MKTSDVFYETDTPLIHTPLNPEPDTPCDGWVSRSTYLSSVRQLTAVNRCVSGHLKTVSCALAVSGVVNVVMLIMWVLR